MHRVTGLSTLRIALVLPVMGLVLAGGYGAAAGLFLVAVLTDFLDGYLARRWRVTSALGSFLDTTADKILVAGVLIALVSVDRASPWLATVIVARELAVLGLRGVVAAGGTVMAPSIWGKVKANVQFVALFMAMLRVDARWGPWHPDEWVLAVAAGLALVSAGQYFARFAGAVPATGRAT